MGTVAGSGMAYQPCSSHDPGGVATGHQDISMTANRDMARTISRSFRNVGVCIRDVTTPATSRPITTDFARSN